MKRLLALQQSSWMSFCAILRWLRTSAWTIFLVFRVQCSANGKLQSPLSLTRAYGFCQSAWKFYAVQFHEISAVRMRLLLRILVADPGPFHALLQNIYRTGTPWELRIQASTRLFKIILDLPSPAFSLEDRRWRSSISDIFTYYFSAIWSDEAVSLAFNHLVCFANGFFSWLRRRSVRPSILGLSHCFQPTLKLFRGVGMRPWKMLQ
jgi:hypothetical protein